MRTIQYQARAGMLDLSWGHPDPDLLPLDGWRVATQDALRAYGWRALTYGYAAGPAPLLAWLRDRLGEVDARAPEPAELFVTAGASQGLELVSGMLAPPGSAVVVDAPTYHLALRILGDRGVRLVPAPADEHGMLPEETGALLERVRPALVYLVPTYGNPTGRSLPPERRRALVDVAARAGTVIVEDDTYREITFAGTAPPSLWSLADGETVVRLGSFAKSVAPGLRLGYLTGPAGLVARLADRGHLDSGGGLNHTTALAMAEFGASGAFDRHVRDLRRTYATRRDALAAAVEERLGVPVERPDGGWFLWLDLPVDAGRLLAAAEAPASVDRGVSFLPGGRFHVTEGRDDRRARLAYSMLKEPDLREAAGRLGAALATVRGG